MAGHVKIKDGLKGNGKFAGVTQNGQLVTSPIEYNQSVFTSLTVANQVYNFIKPRTNKRFVIDGLIFSADKNTSQSDGTILRIYESNSATNSIATKLLFSLDLGRLQRGNVPSLNVITSEGIWINATTTSPASNLTLLGYYIDATT